MNYPIVGIEEKHIAYATRFIGDLKAFGRWNSDSWEKKWTREVVAGICALHAVVAPDADLHATAVRMMYSIPRAQLDRAAEELAEVLMRKIEVLEYHYLGGDMPEYLRDNPWQWRGMALALAYALPDWQNLPATKFEPYIPWEKTPEGIAAQEEKDVEHALLSWPEYVRHQISPKQRADYAPTAERLAKRLEMTVEAVCQTLARLGREVAA